MTAILEASIDMGGAEIYRLHILGNLKVVQEVHLWSKIP